MKLEALMNIQTTRYQLEINVERCKKQLEKTSYIIIVSLSWLFFFGIAYIFFLLVQRKMLVICCNKNKELGSSINLWKFSYVYDVQDVYIYSLLSPYIFGDFEYSEVFGDF